MRNGVDYMNYPIKYIIAPAVGAVLFSAPYYFPKESLEVLFVVWFMLIPVVFIAFLVYGLILYIRSMKHSIVVSIKPAEAIRALARRNDELRRVKHSLYEEVSDGIRKG